MDYTNLTRSGHPADPTSLSNLEEAINVTKTTRTALPVILEFTGMPKAGKTTVINRIKRGLTDLGFKVSVISEAATEKVSGDLKSDLFLFNTQCMLINIQEVLKAINSGEKYDFVILDRGLFDSSVWIEFVSKIGLIAGSVANDLIKFSQHNAWRNETSSVYFLDCSWETYLNRYQKDTPYQSSPKLNKEYFNVLHDRYISKIDEQQSQMKSFLCNDSEPSSLDDNWQQTHDICQFVIQDAINLLVDKSTEEIAVVEAQDYKTDIIIPFGKANLSNFIEEVFQRTDSGTPIHKRDAYSKPVSWMNRAEAEKDDRFLQLVAAAYITKNGNYLVLERSSFEDRDELKNKLSLIVGGHIDKIDGKPRWGGSNEVESCLIRELKEELSYIDMPKIEARFAIRTGTSKMGKQHLSLVHEIEVYNESIEPIQTPGAGNYLPNPQFRNFDWLVQNKESFDEWSIAIIDYLQTIPEDAR